MQHKLSYLYTQMMYEMGEAVCGKFMLSYNEYMGVTVSYKDAIIARFDKERLLMNQQFNKIEDLLKKELSDLADKWEDKNKREEALANKKAQLKANKLMEEILSS